MSKEIVKELLAKRNNTRNFSHLKTSSGKTILPDIYRSNLLNMSYRSKEYQIENIRTVVDLRILEEGGGEKQPSFVGSQHIHLPFIFGNLAPLDVNALMMEGDLEKLDQFFRKGYQTFCDRYPDEIKMFFEILSHKSNLPLLFHCSAGKDRTGVLAALFLKALGVSKEDIVSDYLQTNQKLRPSEVAGAIIDRMKDQDVFDDQSEYSKLEASLTLLLSVKKEWIELFFESIEKRYGTSEDYLKRVLGIDLDSLQSIYLIE